MRTLATGLVVLGLAALVGCNTSPPGGSHGSGSAGATHRSETFTIHAPLLTTDLNQGETKDVKVTLDRGKDFKDDVSLKFDAPKELKVEPAEHTVKAGDPADVTVKISADKDASVGEHMIKVTGTPKSGTATSVDFKVKVAESKAKS
jgi:uncharacterized membrane protein